MRTARDDAGHDKARTSDRVTLTMAPATPNYTDLPEAAKPAVLRDMTISRAALQLPHTNPRSTTMRRWQPWRSLTKSERRRGRWGARSPAARVRWVSTVKHYRRSPLSFPRRRRRVQANTETGPNTNTAGENCVGCLDARAAVVADGRRRGPGGQVPLPSPGQR